MEISKSSRRRRVPLALAALAALAALGCRARATVPGCEPGPAAPAAAVAHLIDRDNARDLEGVLAGYTEDVTWYPPQGPPVRGRAALRPRYERLFAAQPRLVSEVIEAGGDRDSGFVVGTTHGTLTPLDGGPPTAIDDRFIALVRCEAGRWRVSHLFWAPR